MFVFKSRVYFSDTDAGGIAYHARYLDWAEHARTEMLRSALPHISQEEFRNMGLVFVVRSISIDYISPAYLDDEIRVETECEKMGAVSGVFLQRIYRDDTMLSEMHVKVGFIDKESKRPVKLPKEIADALV